MTGFRAREFLARLAGLVRRRPADPAADEELLEHLRLLEAEYQRRGLGPEEARRAARLAFGNVTAARESYADQRTLPAVESVIQDLRYGARTLRRTPGFTVAAVLTLALGIGLNTTVFTALDAVAFRPLPVKDGEHLVRLERWFASESRGDVQFAFSESEFHYLAAHARALSDLILAGWPRRVQELSGERPLVQFVSANYFSALGVVPAAGGSFSPSGAGSDAEVVLSYAFWTARYGADPAIAGRTIVLNGAAFTIAGVAPSVFVGTANPPQVPDVWAPISAEARMSGAQGLVRRFQLLGHVHPDLTFGAAAAQVGALTRPLAEAFRVDDPTTALTLERAAYFGETNDPRFRAFVLAVMAVVALVLLIACANLANMLLARAAGRQREIGLRLALGASRARIVRQLLTESALLALGGGACGLALSVWASKGLWILIAEPVLMFAHGDVAPLIHLAPDARVFGFTLAVSACAAAAFALLPALRLSNPGLIGMLKDDAAWCGGRTTGAAPRRWFVGGQVAVSMALLLAAGLLLRGMDASRNASTGYDTSRVFDVLYSRGADSAASLDRQTRIAAELSRVPGLAVALADRMPLAGTWTPPMMVEGPVGRITARTLANRVSPQYFSTLGVPVVRGRGFREREQRGAAVALVSERAAQRFWPGADPLGRSFAIDTNFKGAWQTFQVVGVVRDVRTANLSRIDPSYVYLPLDPSGHDHLIVRSTMGPREAGVRIRAAVGAVDAALLGDLRVTSLDEGPLRLWRALVATLAAFGATLSAIALGLAVAGIYGIVSYLAAARRHEIGVRMALGADRWDVLRLVVADALGPVAIGAGAGLALALLLSALVRSSLDFPGTPDVLYGVSPFDLVTFGGVTALLAIVTVAASAGPLWRAMRLDPITILRE